MRLLALPFACGALALACAAGSPAPELPSSPAAPKAASRAPAPAQPAPPPPAPPPCAARGAHAVRAPARAGSSLALVEDGARRLLYAADGDNHALHTIDADVLVELAVTELPGRPAQLLPLADGRVLVTLRDRNAVVALEPGARPEEPLTALCERATYTEPFGLAVSPDGARVALTAGYDHELMLLDARSLDVERTADLPDEPRGVLLSGDGETAYVAHLIGGVVSSVSLAHPDEPPQRIFARPAPPKEATAAKVKGPGANGKGKAPPKPINPSQELAAAQGFALVEASLGADGDKPWPARVLVPMASSDPMRFGADATFPSVYGGGGRVGAAVIGAFVAVIDPVTKTPLGGEVAPLRQARPEDCILPRAAAAYEGRLFVACAGTDRVVELDAHAVDPISAERNSSPVGEGPTGIVVDPAQQRALVLSEASLDITVLGLAPDAKGGGKRLRLARPATPALSAQLARGRRLFHVTRDVRTSFDGRACASCHPDGRADGLTWATPDGPRQTIVLAGRADRAGPFGWFGDHPGMKNHVALTVKRLGGLGFEQTGGKDDAADLDAPLAYVRSLRLPSRAGALVDEGVEARRARGRELFYAAETGCSGCHFGDATDGDRHDVGSGDPREAHRAFLTPALRGVAASAPYFHDGRYPTLFDLLSDASSKMGHSAQLPTDDRRALAAYLESL